MTNRIHTSAPQTYARMGGLLYLFIIVVAAFGEIFVRNRLIVWGSATRTATQLLGSEMLFRVGVAGEMLTCVCDVALAMILYVLLKPVGAHLSLLAAFLRLTFVAIYAVAKLFEIAALVALENTNALEALSASQSHDLAYLFLRVHSLGYGAGLLFFGFSCILVGHLIRRSGYLPRNIGILLAIAGFGYVGFSVAQMLSPKLAASVLFPWVFPLAFVAESALCLWLLVKGVDPLKWNMILRAASSEGSTPREESDLA